MRDRVIYHRRRGGGVDYDFFIAKHRFGKGGEGGGWTVVVWGGERGEGGVPM